MQDRFLFRGKCVDTGRWMEGGYFVHYARQLSPMGDYYKDGDIIHLICQSGFADWNMPRPIQGIDVVPDTVGQCTGLRDKNGTLIFEGDICKSIDGLFLIAWDDKKCAYLMRFHDYPNESLYMEEMWKDSEVIGNIYDNPELLNG